MKRPTPTYSVIARALIDIYVICEDQAPIKDIHNSRPRALPEDVSNAFETLIAVIAPKYGMTPDQLTKFIRPLLRKRLPQEGTFLGWADEGLDLAQMVGRQHSRNAQR